jgi:hypothetical protein
MVSRIAIALFEDEVSPRFCQAKRANVYAWDGRHAELCAQVQLSSAPYPDRLHMLAAHHVQVLVCGSFPCVQHAVAVDLGIRVLCGSAGPVSKLLKRLGKVLSEPARPCEPAA